MGLLSFIRNRWHPLWRLRQIPAYRRLQNAVDVTVYRKLPHTGVRVAVKLLRDASLFLDSEGVEPEIRAAFTLVIELLNPAVFWDVGANIGFYSWFARRHPAIRQVFLFEPDPANFALITRTIRRNAISDCHPMNVALSDSPGETSFLLDRASGAAGSLESLSHRDNPQTLHHAYHLEETIKCRIETVDHLIQEGATPPDLMKIDVEGAEHLVVAGAASCLAKH